MRWKFPDPSEQAERDTILTAIDNWWSDFRTKTDDLNAFFHGEQQWDLPGWIHSHLGAIDDRIMWEFGPGEPNGHRLVITPEGARHLRPLVEVILERAPELPGWSFMGYRPPESMEWAIQSIIAKGGEEIPDCSVEIVPGDANRIDLTFRSPRFTSEDDDDDMRDAFWLIEALLGEEILDRWIGFVGTSPPDVNALSVSVEELYPGVVALIDDIRAGLSTQLCRDRKADAEWTSWECNPQPAEDYNKQTDLIVAVSMEPTVWSAAHRNSAFWSARFSSQGEVFCYVKIEGTDRPEGGEAEYRVEIEELIDTDLQEAGIGCTIGGGSGIRYCYVDLAVTDAPAAIVIIREVLRARGVPLRSWLLFFDRDWEQEWVGIYDDTPEPPGLNEEE